MEWLAVICDEVETSKVSTLWMVLVMVNIFWLYFADSSCTINHGNELSEREEKVLLYGYFNCVVSLMNLNYESFTGRKNSEMICSRKKNQQLRS